MDRETKTASFLIYIDQAEAIERLAAQQDRSASSVLRAIIDYYLDNQPNLIVRRPDDGHQQP